MLKWRAKESFGKPEAFWLKTQRSSGRKNMYFGVWALLQGTEREKERSLCACLINSTPTNLIHRN